MGKHTKKHDIKTTFAHGFSIREIRKEYWLVDIMISGRRIRKGFKDLKEAQDFCREKRLELINRGVRALDLPDAVRVAALRAMDILRGTGATIVQAAEEYAQRHPKTQGETFRQTCDRYLANMDLEGRRQASIDDKRGKFARLCEGLGERPTIAIDRLDIEQWIAEKGYRSGTAHAYTGTVKTLMAFFKGEKRQHRKADEKPPETWNVNTVATLFKNAQKSTPDLIPALAVLFFAGLRPNEMLRLNWQQIDMAGRVIRLTGDVTKTRTMRNVEITDNLLAWLTAYRSTGPIVESLGCYRQKRETLMENCGIKTWPTDVARHTFATMLYNSIHDAAKVMSQLGHFGNPQTFVTHYKGVPVSASDAADYWKICPCEDDAKILPFATAG